jgi:hypothetical protein
MRAVVVAVLVARSAFAQPPGDPDAAFEACKARRRALTREAMKIADVNERGRALARMPICLRLEDRSTEIIDTIPVAPARPVPLAVHVEACGQLGGGDWMVASPSPGMLAARAPFAEGELGVGVGDTWSFVGFAGYAVLRGDVLYVDTYRMLQAPYESERVLSDVGARARVHHGRLAFGLGVGVEREHATGFSTLTGPRDDTNDYALAEADVGYTLASVDHFAVRIAGIASAAVNATLDSPGNIVSVRLALGVSWRSRDIAVAPP